MKNDNDSLGNRIKSYEDAYRFYIPNRMPIILRLDGCHFSQFTKGCKRPFDQNLIDCLNETGKYLCENIQGVKLAYQQSDEISLLIYNPNFESQGWFNNNLQKMISVSAALASSHFTSITHKIFGETKLAQFDSRAFVVPLDEVVNTILWRQQDCTRNSVQMLARSIFSHKECNDKNCSELKEMCFKKDQDWNKLPISYQRGRCIVKNKILKESIDFRTKEKIIVERSEWIVDNNIPIFSEDRNYIEKYLKIENNLVMKITSQLKKI